MNQSKEMVRLAVEALDEKKGEDIKIIDIQGVTLLQIILYWQAHPTAARPRL